MGDLIAAEYGIEECVHWISSNGFTCVALQLEKDRLKDSAKIKSALIKATSNSNRVNYLFIVSDSCSVDHIAPLQMGNQKVDAIIRFGRTCLAPFEFNLANLPVFFAFGCLADDDQLNFVKSEINNHLIPKETLVLYSTEYSALAKKLADDSSVFEVGKLINYSYDWHFSKKITHLIHNDINGRCGYLGHFWTSKAIEEYKVVLYIGKNLHLSLRLVGATLIDPIKKRVTSTNSSRELSKRISSIESLRSKKKLNLGLLFTNSFPLIDDFLDQIEKIKKKNQNIYKIMLLHSTDECKLGNFGIIDAFVVINACNCSSLLDSLHLHLPILTFFEYQILCGLKCSYGKVIWNENYIEEGVSDDEELAVNTHNQLVLSESVNKPFWYGLEVNSSFEPISIIQEGQKGLPTSYNDEPKL